MTLMPTVFLFVGPRRRFCAPRTLDNTPFSVLAGCRLPQTRPARDRHIHTYPVIHTEGKTCLGGMCVLSLCVVRAHTSADNSDRTTTAQAAAVVVVALSACAPLSIFTYIPPTLGLLCVCARAFLASRCLLRLGLCAPKAETTVWGLRQRPTIL
jgi:hypothetical protein